MFYNYVGGIMERIIFHIDVNNAFLSWSAVKLLKEGYPIDIRTIPAIIAGDETKRHGVVLAKSPVAKRFGIVTAETIYSAKKKCPFLKIFPPDMSYYKEMSDMLIKYISGFSPVLEQFSIDECFLDLTGTHYLYDDVVALAYKMKDEIYAKFGFTVNIGIANNKLLAKMASDFEKPNRVHTLFDTEIESKFFPLPLEDLFMVGKKTATKLRKLGFTTIGSIANSDQNLLIKEFKSLGKEIYEHACGIDLTEVDSSLSLNKSISASLTLPYDTDDIDILKKVLRKQIDEVGRSLRRQNLYASVVTVTFKTRDFVSYSKQMSLSRPISSNEDIYDIVIKILYNAWNFEKIRNIGIRLSKFNDKKFEKIDLFTDSVENDLEKEKFQAAIDKIKDKYGADIINPAFLLENDK